MKIQRYGLVGGMDTEVEMVAREDGDYVHYQDVKKILDILDEFGITDTGKLAHALMVTKDEGVL